MISPIGETKKNKAFTLIEILLVVVIMGVVLALAAPNFSKGYSHFELNKTAEDVLGISRWAQAMAIGQQRVYVLSMAGDHRSYQLVRIKSDTNSVRDDVFEAVHGNLGRRHQLPRGIDLDTNADMIKFYPDGTIDPAAIELGTQGQKIGLSSAAVRGMMIRVDND